LFDNEIPRLRSGRQLFVISTGSGHISIYVTGEVEKS